MQIEKLGKYSLYSLAISVVVYLTVFISMSWEYLSLPINEHVPRTSFWYLYFMMTIYHPGSGLTPLLSTISNIFFLLLLFILVINALYFFPTLIKGPRKNATFILSSFIWIVTLWLVMRMMD